MSDNGRCESPNAYPGCESDYAFEKVGNPTVSKDEIIYKLPLKVFSNNIST